MNLFKNINTNISKGFTNILSPTLLNLFIFMSLVIIICLGYLKYRRIELFDYTKTKLKENFLQPNANNIYQLKSMFNTDKCLYNNADGRFGVGGCNSTFNDQQWKFNPIDASKNVYQLNNINSGKCLYNNNQFYYDKPKDEFYGMATCSNDNNQKWTFIPAVNDTFLLKSAGYNNCLYTNTDGRFGMSGGCAGFDISDQHWQLNNVIPTPAALMFPTNIVTSSSF